jgi:pimeloyl-ACP methyl ester carboxylesterase
LTFAAAKRVNRRRVAVVLICFALLGLAGLYGSVITVGLSLSRPVHANIGLPPSDLAGVEAVEIHSSSGATLSGWWVPGATGKGVVVLMHGVRANRHAMLNRARFLHERNFSVLLFDLQSHGASTGERVTFGHLEALDAATATTFVKQRRPGERIGVIGVSLGGAACLLGSTPLAVDALVLESVYPDIDRALSNRLRTHLGSIVGSVFAPILTPLFEVLMPPIIGVRPVDLRPIDHIGAVTAPVLIASGAADPLTTIAEAASLFNNAPNPKQFWAVPGAGHVDLEQYDAAAYWSVVLPFLERYLRGEGWHRPNAG